MGHVGSRVHGEDYPECSLQGVGDICPRHFGQSYSSMMKRDVVALHQEEIRQLTETASSGKGSQIKKEEEEDATLTSAEQQGKRKKKGYLQGQVLPLWGAWSLCIPVSKEEEQGRGF